MNDIWFAVKRLTFELATSSDLLDDDALPVFLHHPGHDLLKDTAASAQSDINVCQ